jgi:hypothetical protein
VCHLTLQCAHSISRLSAFSLPNVVYLVVDQHMPAVHLPELLEQRVFANLRPRSQRGVDFPQEMQVNVLRLVE